MEFHHPPSDTDDTFLFGEKNKQTNNNFIYSRLWRIDIWFVWLVQRWRWGGGGTPFLANVWALVRVRVDCKTLSFLQRGEVGLDDLLQTAGKSCQTCVRVSDYQSIFSAFAQNLWSCGVTFFFILTNNLQLAAVNTRLAKQVYISISQGFSFKNVHKITF